MTIQKRFKCALGGLAVLGLAAVYNEATGYRMFDRADGSNIACDLDPWCRPLTQNEIDLARETFGARLNYKHIRIFYRPHYAFMPMMVAHRSQAFAPNGHIYILNDDYRTPDYALDVFLQKVYMHEITHIKQREDGTNMLWAALKQLAASRFDYSRSYDYTLIRGKAFSAYNLEQQAEIVGRYVSLRQGLTLTIDSLDQPMGIPMLRSTTEQWVKKICRQLAEYERTLKPVLEDRSETRCKQYALKP